MKHSRRKILFGGLITGGIVGLAAVINRVVNSIPENDQQSITNNESKETTATASVQITLIDKKTKLKHISTGYNFTLGVKEDGSVIGWGNNWSGCVSGTNNLSDIVMTSNGMFHAMALTAGGKVVCWGSNGDGQTSVPANLDGQVIAISAGATYSVALKQDGTVVIWGLTLRNKNTIKPARDNNNIVKISAGGSHIVALKGDGTVVAWGENDMGECNVPSGLTDVVSVAAGPFVSYAVTKDGKIHSWGARNYDKQIGAKEIIVGGNSAIAITSNFSCVDCWFESSFEQYNFVEPIKQITIDDGYLLCLSSSGTIETKITNESLLDTSHHNRYRKNGRFNKNNDYEQVAAGDSHYIALTNLGKIRTWGINESGVLDVPLVGETIKKVVAGKGCSYALSHEGTVFAWGSNEKNKLEIPKNIEKIVDIEVGFHNVIALSESGKIFVWGDFAPSENPNEKYGRFTHIATHFLLTCAVTENGRVVFFSENKVTEIDCPVPVSEIKHIEVSERSMFLVMYSGHVVMYEMPSVNPIIDRFTEGDPLQLIAGNGFLVGLFKTGEAFVEGMYDRLPSEFHKLRDFVQLDVQNMNVIGLRKNGSVVFGFLDDPTDVPLEYRA
jgi:alpha-tubulin suppressor-like RCC1 family protein